MKPWCKLARLKIVIYFLFPLFTTQPFTAAAQFVPDYRNVDAVLSQLNKSRSDSNRVKLLNELSLNYLSKEELTAAEFEVVFKHLQHAVALCDSLDLRFVTWKARSIQLLGNALILGGKVAEGKSVLMELIKNARAAGDKKREAENWIVYASAFSTADRTFAFEKDAETACVNAINIYRAINDKKGEVNAMLELGGVYHRVNKYAKCEELLLDVVKTSEAAGNYRLPVTYLFLSATSRYRGNYNKALGYSLQAVKGFEDSKETYDADAYYGELAEVYQALNKHVESVIWYKRCIESRELNAGYSSYYLYRTYSLLIDQLIKSGAQKEALATIKSLQKRRPPGSLRESAVLFQCMAYCYDAENVYDSTEKYYLKTLETFRKAAEIAEVAQEINSLAYYDVADFYVRHQQFEKARPYLSEVTSDTSPLKVSEMADAHLLLFKVDSASGNYLAAIKHIQQYKALSDSVLNENKSRQIEQLQIEYETVKKDQEITLLTKRDRLQQAYLRQANIIKNWILASAGLLVLLLVLGYNRYRFKQKTNKKLETQQVVINQKNISLQRLVNEKEWLIKEIHHRVKNNFHIVMGLLGTQSGYLKNEEAIAAMKESRQRIHAMSLIHQKLYQSEDLSSIDMREYIYEMVDSLKESFDKSVSVQFHLQIDRVYLDLSHVIPVGLILNEAITNVYKHAFPGRQEGNIYISFAFNTSENSITLSVTDDGTGLPEGFSGNGETSMGLNLMRGLSEDIDGVFSIRSNNGTAVTLSFIYQSEFFKNFVSSSPGQNFSV